MSSQVIPITYQLKYHLCLSPFRLTLHLSYVYIAFTLTSLLLSFSFFHLSSDSLYQHYIDTFIEECNTVDRTTSIREQMLPNSSKCFYQKCGPHHPKILLELRYCLLEARSRHFRPYCLQRLNSQGKRRLTN